MRAFFIVVLLLSLIFVKSILLVLVLKKSAYVISTLLSCVCLILCFRSKILIFIHIKCINFILYIYNH